MTCAELDWAAPIVPGQSMMGVRLGLPYADVVAALRAQRVAACGQNDFIVQFMNSPPLLVDLCKDGIVLRDKTHKAAYAEANDELLVMAFRNGALSYFMIATTYGGSLDYYKGLMWGEIGLGSPVIGVKKFCEVEFDSGDELFYPIEKTCAGFSMGGSCSSLEIDPAQVVSCIRIFVPRVTSIQQEQTPPAI